MSNEPRRIDQCDGEVLTITELGTTYDSEGQPLAIDVTRTSAFVVFSHAFDDEPDADDLEELEQLRLELLAEDECDDETNQLDREAQAREEHDNEAS